MPKISWAEWSDLTHIIKAVETSLGCFNIRLKHLRDYDVNMNVSPTIERVERLLKDAKALDDKIMNMTHQHEDDPDD